MNDEVLEILQRVVYKETRWLRHYLGEVFNNVDPSMKGRVLVTLIELGFETPDKGMWVFPRQGDSMNVPNIGDWVEVYFMAGDPNRPVYLPYASEIVNNTPNNFDGLPTTKLIWEDKITGAYIKYNALTSTFEMKGALFIELLGATESLIKGDTAKIELDKDADAMTELQSAINGWTPAGGDGGAALKTALATFLTKPMANYTSILSLKIKVE